MNRKFVLINILRIHIHQTITVLFLKQLKLDSLLILGLLRLYVIKKMICGRYVMNVLFLSNNSLDF